MSVEPGSTSFDVTVAEIAKAWWAEWKTLLATLTERFLPEDRSELVVGHGGQSLLAAWRDGEQEQAFEIEDGAASARALQTKRHGREAVLQLAPGDVLQTSLRLPAARQSVLLRAIAFEIERVSPIPADEIYFDFRIAGRDQAAKTADVDIRIVRRKIVDDLKIRCREAGFAIAAIRFADGSLAGAGTFPIDAAAATKSRLRRSRLRIAAGAVPVLAAALLLAFYLRGEQVLDSLDDRIAADSIASTHVEQLRRRIERTTQQLRFLGEQKRSPLFATVLADVTHTLPDGSWLTEFDMTGGKIRIEGYSRAASDLIAVFDRSGRFANAQFAAPVTQGAAPGVERFDLSFDLAGRGR